MAEENQEEEKQFFILEHDGIFEGELVEDMSATVQKTGQQVINVLIPELWEEGQAYPYTWVGGFYNVPPLMKGMKVWVKFNQENFLYPVLWKYEAIDGKIYELPEKPEDGEIIEFPTFDDDETIQGARMIGTTGFIMETTKHLLLHYENELFISEIGKGTWINLSEEFGLKVKTTELKILENLFHLVTKKDVVELKMTDSEFEVFTKQDTTYLKMGDTIFQLYSKDGSVGIKMTDSVFNAIAGSNVLNMEQKIKFGQSNTLGTMVSSLLQHLINICKQLESLTTIGGPTSQSINPSVSLAISQIDMQLNTLKTQWEAVFE